MNRIFLFLMLLASVSYSTDINACIVLPQNSVNVAGPTAICGSAPTQSYNVSYSAGIDDPYLLSFTVMGGTVSNVEPYNSIFGVPTGPGTCVPQLALMSEGDCFSTYDYDVAPACRGGVTFDVTWDEECGMEDMFVEAFLFYDGPFLDDTQTITYNPNCFGDGNTQGLVLTGGSVNNTQEDLDVSIFPNPATDSNVTISIPSDYEDSEVNIIDLNGKLVQSYSKVNDQLLINTSELNGSFYFVQVVTADGVVDTQKLMLAK